jgi:hypothetical protein
MQLSNTHCIHRRARQGGIIPIVPEKRIPCVVLSGWLWTSGWGGGGQAKKNPPRGGLQYRFGLVLADNAGCPENGSEGDNADDAKS